jgi:hypothetical protein
MKADTMQRREFITLLGGAAVRRDTVSDQYSWAKRRN